MQKEMTKAHLGRGVYPHWFSLGYAEAPRPQLTLELSRQSLERYFETLPLARRQTLFGSRARPTFQKGLDGEPLGFGGIFKPEPGASKELRFGAVLRPQGEEGDECMCDRVREGDRICVYCAGTGVRLSGTRDTRLICRTLCEIWDLSYAPKKSIALAGDPGRQQLYALLMRQGYAETTQGYYQISVILTDEVARYLKGQAGETLPEVERAMWKAFRHLNPVTQLFIRENFSARVNPDGTPVLEAAYASLAVGDDPRRPVPPGALSMRAYEVRTDEQFLALLCGLAVLFDKVTTALYGTSA